MTEVYTGERPLDVRVTEEINQQVGPLRTIVESLLQDSERHRSQLDPLGYYKLVGKLTSIKEAVSGLNELLQSPDGKIAHDANSKLAVALGMAEILLGDTTYESRLSPSDYASFRRRLATIGTAVQNLTLLFSSLGGVYKGKEQGVEMVDAQSLKESEETVYRIIHVDDNESIRYIFKDALTKGSNIVNPVMRGFFGHDGKKVRYEVHSYGSVMEALNAMPKLGDIDLLITDREMPNFTGLHLLYAISQLPNSRLRMPGYENIKRIAMLTAGIKPEEAEFVTKTYGATVIDKSTPSLALEQQIYRIINPKPQS